MGNQMFFTSVEVEKVFTLRREGEGIIMGWEQEVTAFFWSIANYILRKTWE